MMKRVLFVTVLMVLLIFSFAYVFHRDTKIERYNYPPVMLSKTVDTARNLYFVFLNGLDTRCDGSPFKHMGFENIRQALSVIGYSFYDNRFLMYSYTGGQINKGNWLPHPYTPKDTGQSLHLSVHQLEQLIESLSLANPEARFILVGHSLGGRIALDFVSTTHPSNRKKIQGVITLNSPLMGSTINVPGILMKILDTSGCIWGSTAVKQLIYESRFYQDLVQLRTSSIKQLQKDGVQIATFSHSKDYFVQSKTSCLMDPKGYPVTAGFVLNSSPNNSKLKNNHMQILDHQSVISYLITLASHAI